MTNELCFILRYKAHEVLFTGARFKNIFQQHSN